jgi:hypothetical protein
MNLQLGLLLIINPSKNCNFIFKQADLSRVSNQAETIDCQWRNNDPMDNGRESII